MMKFLILALSLLSVTEAWKTYEGYRVYKIIPEKIDQVKQLRILLENDIELDVWKPSRGVGDEAHVMVSPDKSLDFAELMVNKGFSLGIHIENLGENMAELRTHLDARDESLYFDENGWNTLDETNTYMENLANNCAGGITCEWASIGTSYDGRAINVFRIYKDDLASKQTVYIDSLQHCREWLSGTTVNKMIIQLVNNEADQGLLDRYAFHFVPIANPDGYVYTWGPDRLWRKNREPNTGSACVGTDLNRNFAVDVGGNSKWCSAGASNNTCSDTYCGRSAASAPETKVIQAYLANLSNKLVMISIHAYAKMWLQPFGHEDGGSCARAATHGEMLRVGEAAEAAIEATGGQSWVAGTVCEVIYAAAGGCVDHAYANAGFPYSYTPELRGNSFIVPDTEIEPAFLETWAGVKALLDAIENPLTK